MKTEKEMWAEIINDARFYDGTPKMFVELTERFEHYYTIAQNLKQPDVIKSVCRHNFKNGEHTLNKCTECGESIYE